MIENLLPGIELVNGDCAAVLPGLPPAGLIAHIAALGQSAGLWRVQWRF